MRALRDIVESAHQDSEDPEFGRGGAIAIAIIYMPEQSLAIFLPQ